MFARAAGVDGEGKARTEEEDELDAVDDWSSAWAECRDKGLKWGGRGRGGRGVQRNTWQPKDVWIEGVTLAYLGKAGRAAVFERLWVC